MSLLAVGLSHRSTPVELLERVALDGDRLNKLIHDLVRSEHISEALVLATCNRLEVHADVTKFHGGVKEIGEALAAHTGVELEVLTDHLYVHYEDRAVQHVFEVAAGLDSMVVGEQQILGQLRTALNLARDESTLGRSLGSVVDNALRVGKRAHTETGIDRAGRSIVGAGIELAQTSLGALAGKSAVVVGAGSMSTIAASELAAAGAAQVTIVNRTLARGQRLAEQVGGRAVSTDDLGAVIADADLVISCTGALGIVVPAEVFAGRDERPVFVLDLAMPRDVDPSARGYLARQRADRVAPTVVALRERAQQVVDAEMSRLLGRLPDADERTVRELRQAVERVVDKLLHTPTVRVKELAEAPGGDSYADVLRELFALDPSATEAVARAAVVVEDEGATS